MKQIIQENACWQMLTVVLTEINMKVFLWVYWFILSNSNVEWNDMTYGMEVRLFFF